MQLNKSKQRMNTEKGKKEIGEIPNDWQTVIRQETMRKAKTIILISFTSA